MQVKPEQPKAPFIERRQAARRREDVDSSYNDGGKAPPMEVAKATVLYLFMLWVAVTAVIGTYVLFKWLWNVVHR